jgi:hypothetical protein
VGGVVFFVEKLATEETADVVIEEVVLLPLVERLIEFRLQLRVIRARKGILGDAVDLRRLAERGLIKRLAVAPGALAEAVQIHATEIIEPHTEALLIEGLDAGHMHAELRQTPRGGDELRIVPPGHGIDHEDHRRVGVAGPVQPVKMPIRAAFDDGLDLARGVTKRGKLLDEMSSRTRCPGRNRFAVAKIVSRTRTTSPARRSRGTAGSSA